jgi:hypothetical protein
MVHLAVPIAIKVSTLIINSVFPVQLIVQLVITASHLRLRVAFIAALDIILKKMASYAHLAV